MKNNVTSMPHSRLPTVGRPLALLLALAATVAGCGGPELPDAVAFEGARLITGTGEVIDQSVIIVNNGLVEAVGPATEVDASRAGNVIDVEGRTIMPALNNAHFHLPSERAARRAALQEAAYYGTGATLSMGLDEGPVGLQMRLETLPDAARSLSAGRGITSPEPGRSEVPFWVTSEEEARAAVRELAGQEVDVVKIWVDSRGGQYERLAPDLYGAVIDEAHANGLRVAAHVFTLEDAKGLLRAGVDIFAHGIRDMDVDDEVVELWKSRPEVVLIPNLPSPGVPSEVTWLAGTVPSERIAQMRGTQGDNPAQQEAFGIQARNLVRLHAEGIPVAFGTDGGNPWTVHQELEDMVRAGLEPADVLVAATSTSAAVMGLDDTGSLRPGQRADFVVLDRNPLEDITNTRSITDVYLAGVRVDRDAISARLLGER